MDEIPDMPPQEVSSPTDSLGGTRIWKFLLYSILGTTISILITFGTGALIQQHRKAQDRKMTAMMVMGNIEKFAQKIDDVVVDLKKRDTLATYLLRVPVDSLDSPEYASVVACKMPYLPRINYDKTAETVFTNTIGTWRSKKDFGFINMAGICFSAMKTIEEIYGRYIKESSEPEDRIRAHPDDYPGETLNTKLLRDKEYREKIGNIHGNVGYYSYLADKVRTLNAINMHIMEVTEEEVLLFVKDNEAYIEANQPENLKRAKDFVTPDINPDSLPDFETWIAQGNNSNLK